jgi:hypothetical protein
LNFLNTLSISKKFLAKQLSYCNFTSTKLANINNKYSTNKNIFLLLLFYSLYLVLLNFYLYFSSNSCYNFIYSVMYLHLYLTSAVYLSFNFLLNFLLHTYTFKSSYQSIYLLTNLNDLQLTNNLSYVLNFRINDFYQFIILKYLNDISLFISEVIVNYLNYPIFILFAVLFFLTSFFSLLSLSYLGFYGVFILNFISLFLL